MEAYENIVRRAEMATGRKLTDFETILFLGEEIEELREKVKQLEGHTSANDDFARFREAAFKWILDSYEHMTGDEQRIFDFGELYGRLKALEEDMENG